MLLSSMRVILRLFDHFVGMGLPVTADVELGAGLSR